MHLAVFWVSHASYSFELVHGKVFFGAPNLSHGLCTRSLAHKSGCMFPVHEDNKQSIENSQVLFLSPQEAQTTEKGWIRNLDSSEMVFS